MEHSKCEPTNTRNPVKAIDPRVIAIGQTQRQKGNENQVETLGIEPVHETKILSKGTVNRRNRLPPTEFVNEENASKNCHVNSQHHVSQFINGSRRVDTAQDSQSPHCSCEGDIEK